MKLLVIGGGTAGTTAALFARKENREAEIVLASREKVPEYSKCALPYALSGEVDFQDIIYREEEWYSRTAKVELRLGWEAVGGDLEERKIEFRTLNGKEREEYFDSLIIATGSKPKALPIPIEGEVFYFNEMSHAENLMRKALASDEALIVGGGLIGIEVAEALLNLGLGVTVVELLPWILPNLLDRDFSATVEKWLEEEGLEIIKGIGVESISEDDGRKIVRLKNGEERKVDFVVISVGISPEVSLAKSLGIETGETGGISVDEYMKTNVEEVYAAGDCVETLDLSSKRKVISGSGSVAFRQGIVAGVNSVGGEALYRGSPLTRCTSIFGKEIASVGLTEFLAQTLGIKYVKQKVKGKNLPEYLPGDDVHFKLLVEKRTGRIIGAQGLGRGSSWRANLISLAISKDMTVDDLFLLETCYSPKISEVYDVVSLATDVISKRVRRGL